MTKGSAYVIVFVCMGFLGCSSTKVESNDVSESEEEAYCTITESTLDQLNQFARERGFDLVAELEKAYYEKDKDALARFFRFSLTFKSLDQNARTYGQLLWNSCLNLGEAWGPDEYSSVVIAQSPEVQQRVRDFLYFPGTRMPKEELAQNGTAFHETFPALFPTNYQFDHNDPLFKK